MSDPIHPPPAEPPPRPSVGRIVWRVVLLAVWAIVLYVFAPQLIEVFRSVDQLSRATWWLLILVLVSEGAAFVCAWGLIRVALPEVSWFVAGTAQTTGNAVSRLVPGGAAVGAATSFRMLAVSGVRESTAGAAMTAVSLIQTMVTFAVPFVAVLLALVGTPIPSSLVPVALAGAAVTLLLAGVVATLVVFDRPLELVGRVAQRVAHWLGKKFKKSWNPTPEGFLQARDRTRQALGPNWKKALAYAVGNRFFEYGALVAALWAVGAEPRFSLILLAYGSASVLAMIPLTPGGLGFVEAGLVGLLTVAGVSPTDALVATLAFRLASFWLPIPGGLVAYLMFRHRYGRPARLAVTGEPD